MKRALHILVVVAAACLGMTACGDSSCYDNGNSLPLATFYLDGKQQTIPGLTIMGIGSPGDSLLANNASLGESYLPLRASVGSTSYLLSRRFTVDTVSTDIRDTLTFYYDAVPFFHSVECGTMFNFDIKKVVYTTHGIDSVVMLTTLITNSPTPALRVYFNDSNP